MVARFELQLSRVAPATHFRIVGFRIAIGNVVGQQVRKAEFYIVQRLLNFLQGGLVTLELVAEIFHRCEQWRDVVTLSFRRPNTFGAAIAFAAQRLCLHLERFTALFQRKVTISIKYETAPGEIPGNLGCRLPEKLGINHYVFSLPESRGVSVRFRRAFRGCESRDRAAPDDNT